MSQLNQQELKNRLKDNSRIGKFAHKYVAPAWLVFDRYLNLNINPNYVSLLSSLVLLLGFLSINNHQYILTGLIVLVSLLLDGYDGVLARRLKKSSISGATFDLVNDKFRDMIIGILIYYTSNNAIVQLIGLLYGPINILYSYIRTLVFQNEIYTILLSFNVAFRYIILTIAYIVLHIFSNPLIFGIILSVNIIVPLTIFGFYYITLFRIALLQSNK